MTRRTFLSAGLLAAAAGRNAFADRAPDDIPPGTPKWTGSTDLKSSLKLRAKDRAKLLQLTDLHFFGSPFLPARDKRTLEEMPRLVDAADPDLLLITGDLWHDNPEGKGAGYMETAVGHIEALGRPWVFVWGNHDQVDDFVKGHERITTAKHSLYRGGPTGGNYVVQLTGDDGKPVWQLACLNSNDEGLGPAQRAWLKDEAPKLLSPVPTVALAHIPIKQQADAWAAKQAAGIKLENVSHEDEDGSTLAAIKAACDVRAFFCGHDHVNDYTVTVDGVELVYGHSSGWGGYGSNEMPKGAKLITLNTETGRHAWETWLMDGSKWQPKPGVAIDKVLDSPWDAPAKSSQHAQDQKVN